MKHIEMLEQVLDNGFTGKTAVIDKEKAVTYNELRGYSHFLAEVLLKREKLRADDTVLIYLDKKIEAIISIFGTLMAGAAYVPLDISLPAERLEDIIEDCKPKFILTRTNISAKLPERIKHEYNDRILTVNLEENRTLRVGDTTRPGLYAIDNSDAVPGAAGRLKARAGSPENLAYIIFTSGSSGKPKGVMIKHKSVTAFVEEIKRMSLYDSDTRFLNISPLYFDASVLDIFPVLAVGGTLILMKKLVLPNEIVVNMDKYKVTDTLMVSSLLRLFGSRYSNLHHFKLPHLKTIWYGAEACPVEVLRRIKEQLPRVQFIHGYGPTETTHTATLLRFKEMNPKYRDYMPIGKPLSTVHTCALTENGRHIETGEIGELYIGGIQLMAGYINDPARTSAALVPDRTKKSTVVYKTGDLVSTDEDNNYVFKGRYDDLVKIGGNLVSLCEIQNSILTNPGVSDAIVVPIGDALFNNKLTVFVVKKDEPLQESDLIEYLDSKLAAYKIPGTFIFIDEKALPRTPNGKIDKAALIKIAENHNHNQ
jgi:amino acid adenylation domain-containing protein